MKVQKFDNYTFEEKENILKHLWTYYGQSEYSSFEYEKYQELIKKDADRLYEFAVFMFMSEINFQSTVLKSMNDGAIKLFLDKLPNITPSTSFIEQYNNASNNMLTEVLYTYNNPELNSDLNVKMDNSKVKKLVLDRKSNKDNNVNK